MSQPLHVQPPAWPIWAWSSAGLVGVVVPATVFLLMANGLLIGAPTASILSLILAVSLMGAGMITGAASGRFWLGALIAVMAGAGLLLFGYALGLPATALRLSTGFALLIASISFAARGALFARSAANKGWLVAVAVVAGEAAIVATAAVSPDVMPDWLLALLPAQWASTAIQAALTGAEVGADAGGAAAKASLFALVGTAAATLVVVVLWPRRWTYLLMFTAWLGCSALVWQTA